EDSEAPGWLLTGTETGAWALHLSDGKGRYDYEPTAARQPINDGKWHQLGFSFEGEKGELWMYYDGQNVAIYNTPGLKSLKSELRTVIGGTRAKWDYHGQWEAFNGYLDEIKIWDKVPEYQLFENSFRNHFPERAPETSEMHGPLKVMAWNIWHGGRHFGKEVGVERVIETIRNSNADVIGMIETYGSGAIIADALGYHFYLISSNLSIMSRFPITETIQAFRPFNFGGAKIRLSNNQEMIYFNTWLHYLPDVKKSLFAGNTSASEQIKNESDTRLAEVNQVLAEIKPFLDQSDQVPVIMGGDFNTASHLDWTERTKAIHLDYVIEWPVTISMEKAGFTDTYRAIYPDPLMWPGYSFWPYGRKGDTEKYLESRIDYIFSQGEKLKTINATVLNYHPVMWPSDHAAAITEFQFQAVKK
ncbi:endonuclease/exonuclease/phosphatase family protein, partial [bacterium]|nr:endonuclease/exonuclease/phosphatase family protein [bacterium]